MVLNNQIGFTARPEETRSTRYPTDIGKASGVPILHVNADDVEAVVSAFELAAEWRQTFGRDVILDLVGYRRALRMTRGPAQRGSARRTHDGAAAKGLRQACRAPEE